MNILNHNIKSILLLGNYTYIYLSLSVIVLIFFQSCSKDESKSVKKYIEVENVVIRDNIEIHPIEEVGSCANVIEISKREDCTELAIKNIVFTDLNPFVDCEIVGTYWFTICKSVSTGNFKQVFINEPKFTYNNCPELDAYLERYPRRRHEIFNQINEQALNKIENIIWNDENFEVFSCNDYQHNIISWVHGTCSAWRLFEDIFGNMQFHKVSCEGSGCCFRNTYFCYNGQDTAKVTSSVEMVEPLSDCPSSEANGDYEIGYGPCTVDCSNN